MNLACSADVIDRLGSFFGLSGSFCGVIAAMVIPSAFIASMYFTK